MKAAMLAIVLLVASVIILIFANTLNSWVLGGLIGGLAALLISIPISLLIFTSLAHRHDERLFAQMAEQEAAANTMLEYDEDAEVYETEAYAVPGEDEVYYQEQYYEDDYRQQYRYENARLNRQQEMRSLPAPRQPRQAPNAPAPQYSQARQPNQRTGHQRQPRSPQTTRSLRSLQQSAALRAAMREAEQDQTSIDDMPTRQRAVTTRNQFSQKPGLHRSEQERTSTSANRSMPYKHNDGARPRTGDLQTTRNQAEQARYNPVTGPMRLNPETEKIARSPQPGEEYTTTESWTGALNTPMVRRAPYLYQDDALHEHFAQQVNKPIARRSSRYLQPQEQEE